MWYSLSIFARAFLYQTVDSVGKVGEDSSLALDSSGKAHISYIDDTNTALNYAVKSGGIWSKNAPQNGYIILSNKHSYSLVLFNYNKTLFLLEIFNDIMKKSKSESWDSNTNQKTTRLLEWLRNYSYSISSFNETLNTFQSYIFSSITLATFSWRLCIIGDLDFLESNEIFFKSPLFNPLIRVLLLMEGGPGGVWSKNAPQNGYIILDWIKNWSILDFI